MSLEFLLGTAPCPWNSCWENASPAPRAATGGAGAPHPSRGSRAARRGQGSSLHGQQDRRTLCQSQHPTIQASGSAQQLHSGIGSARAPLELRFCPKRPQKAAPPPELGLAHPNPARAPPRAPLTWARWESPIPALLRQGILNSSPGKQGKSSAWLFLGAGSRGRAGGGNYWLEMWIRSFSLCWEFYIRVYIIPCRRILSWDKTWIWDKKLGFGINLDTQALITQKAQPGVQLPVLLENHPESSGFSWEKIP